MCCTSTVDAWKCTNYLNAAYAHPSMCWRDIHQPSTMANLKQNKSPRSPKRHSLILVLAFTVIRTNFQKACQLYFTYLGRNFSFNNDLIYANEIALRTLMWIRNHPKATIAFPLTRPVQFFKAFSTVLHSRLLFPEKHDKPTSFMHTHHSASREATSEGSLQTVHGEEARKLPKGIIWIPNDCNYDFIRGDDVVVIAVVPRVWDPFLSIQITHSFQCKAQFEVKYKKLPQEVGVHRKSRAPFKKCTASWVVKGISDFLSLLSGQWRKVLLINSSGKLALKIASLIKGDSRMPRVPGTVEISKIKLWTATS